MFIYINGQVVAKDDASISPFEHGFLYGMGVFETFRVYNGHPFLLDDHIERLNDGLKALHIEKRFTREEVLEAVKLLLEKNKLKDAYIRFNVSAGNGEIGLPLTPYTEPNVIIFMKPLPPAGELFQKQAVLLQLKRNTPEGDVRLKSHHYMNNLLAKREIGNDPNVEGVFLTEDGFLAEGIVSNLFWIKENVLYTPSVNTGILNGITRQFVIEIGKRNNLKVQEGLFLVEELSKAEEVFVTNSIQEIVPIVTFHHIRFPGVKGRWVQKLHQDYRDHCERLWTRRQVK